MRQSKLSNTKADRKTFSIFVLSNGFTSVNDIRHNICYSVPAISYACYWYSFWNVFFLFFFFLTFICHQLHVLNNIKFDCAIDGWRHFGAPKTDTRVYSQREVSVNILIQTDEPCVNTKIEFRRLQTNQKAFHRINHSQRILYFSLSHKCDGNQNQFYHTHRQSIAFYCKNKTHDFFAHG